MTELNSKISMAVTMATAQREHAEKTLDHDVEWLLNDIVSIANDDRYDLRMKASMLISQLNSSLVSRIQEEYGAYEMAKRNEDFLKGMFEEEREAKK